MDKTVLPIRDIHLPEPISWWPPAPGWFLLPVLVIVLGFAFWRLYKYLNRPNPRRLALHKLNRLHSTWLQTKDDHQLIEDLSILLRRTALTLYPRSEVAGLSGQAWLDWLDQQKPQPLFNNDIGKTLISAPFNPNIHIDAEALIDLSRQWIKA